MTDILNAVAEYYGQFKPSKPSEYLALQLARKLGDGPAFRHYVTLFEHHPEDVIMEAYQQCAAAGVMTGPRFMSNLRALIN